MLFCRYLKMTLHCYICASVLCFNSSAIKVDELFLELYLSRSDFFGKAVVKNEYPKTDSACSHAVFISLLR